MSLTGDAMSPPCHRHVTKFLRTCAVEAGEGERLHLSRLAEQHGLKTKGEEGFVQGVQAGVTDIELAHGSPVGVGSCATGDLTEQELSGARPRT